MSTHSIFFIVNRTHRIINNCVVIGAAEGSLITFIGDKLGLFKAMMGARELTSEELARKTGTHPRIIKEWLAGQAAGGYVVYNSNNGTFVLPEEHGLALTDENSPVYVAGFFQSLVSLFKDEEKIIEAFKTEKDLDGEITIIIFLKEQRDFSNLTM